MRNKLISCLMLFIGISSLYGQKGYMGNAHEIGINLFDLTRNNQFGLEYKYIFRRHTALYGGYQFIIAKDAFPVEGSSASVVSKNRCHVFQTGIMYNSPEAGLSFPVGWYRGWMLEGIAGKIEDSYPGYTGTFDFQLFGIGPQMVFGRNFPLYDNFHMDLSVNLGLYVGLLRIVADPTGTDNIVKNFPKSIYPVGIPFGFDPFINRRAKEVSFFLSYDRFEYYNKTIIFNFHTMPNIKLTYLF